MKHTDWHGRRLSLDLEELTVTEPTCTGDKVTATVSLPDGADGLPLLRGIMAAMALDLRYDLAAREETSNG